MKKLWIVLMIIAMLMAAAVGCSAAPSSNDMKGSGEYEDSGRNSAEDGITTPEESERPAQTDGDFGQKIIYTASLDIQTLDYEASYAAITSALEKAGGYISVTNQRGGMSASGEYSTRYAYFEIRVPVEEYNAFLDGSGNFGNVTNRDETSQDITRVYMDVQARLEALEIQEQRLLELLAKAGSLQDLILLEDRLSQVRAEIESLQAQIRVYDNQVNYCTVHINLQEVYRITPEGQSFWSKLGTTVINSLEVLVAFLYWALIVVIYLLPFAVLGAIGFFVTRGLIRRSKARKQAKGLGKKTPEIGSNGG